MPTMTFPRKIRETRLKEQMIWARNEYTRQVKILSDMNADAWVYEPADILQQMANVEFWLNSWGKWFDLWLEETKRGKIQ